MLKRIPFSPLAEALNSTIVISQSPVNYIISAIKSNDLSFYNLKNEEKFYSISRMNGQLVSNDFFVIRLYTSVYFGFINDYLRNNKILDSFRGFSGFSEGQIRSWVCCLQLALSRNKNVQEDIIVYRGVKSSFPKNIGIGSKFYFKEFISTSVKKSFSEEWIDKKGTVFEIKIKNNGVNGYPNYCYYVEDITVSKNQYEVLISCHSYFTVTYIKHANQIDYIGLICEGNPIKLFQDNFDKGITIVNIDSKILEHNNNYENYLIQWLEKPNNNNLSKAKIKDIKLLYRGSRDGFTSQSFHYKCDNKGETLTIIKSNDNYIFGGYTEINWDSTIWNGICGENNNARREGKGNEFVFTLKNPHNIPPSKYNMKKNWLNHSICCDVNLGPIFGCNDIRIEDNCNIKENKFTYYDFQKGEFCFEDTTGHKRLLFTGKTSFLVKEIEVYKIIR